MGSAFQDFVLNIETETSDEDRGSALIAVPRTRFRSEAKPTGVRGSIYKDDSRPSALTTNHASLPNVQKRSYGSRVDQIVNITYYVPVGQNKMRKVVFATFAEFAEFHNITVNVGV